MKTSHATDPLVFVLTRMFHGVVIAAKPKTPECGRLRALGRSSGVRHSQVPLLGAVLAVFCGSDLRAQTVAWTEITHPTSPAFAHHDMTYDSLRHRLIAAGRTLIMAEPFSIYAGAADGSWTQLPSPSPALPGREDIELAYDSHRDRVVLYTTATNLVWEFDGTDWHVIAAATTPIQCADGAQMQYDPLRRKTVLVGCEGFPEADSPSETWLWDGTDWTLAADADASPRGAAGGGMAFDVTRGDLVLVTHSNMETWTFDGTNWTRRTPATTPTPGVWVFDLAHHTPSGLSVFYGGEHLDEQEPWSSAYPTNAWAWDGVDWRKLEPPAMPPPDIDYAFTFFPERGGLVLHGGWGPGGGWGFRTNVWLLTLETAPQGAIQFTDIRLVGTDVSLISTGQVQVGASQVLRASGILSLPEAWTDVQTNAAPAGTNTWIVPRQGDQRFFRIVERP